VRDTTPEEQEELVNTPTPQQNCYPDYADTMIAGTALSRDGTQVEYQFKPDECTGIMIMTKEGNIKIVVVFMKIDGAYMFTALEGNPNEDQQELANELSAMIDDNLTNGRVQQNGPPLRQDFRGDNVLKPASEWGRR